MVIRISNCNNITSGTISITEGRLNVKYAINGTGKSTVAKAIESAALHDDTGLKKLTPFAYLGDNAPEHQPMVEGLPTDTKVAIFDESYVNQYVFLEDELLKNSFDIFVKTENYEQKMAEINRLIANVRNVFDENPELDSFISDMSEFIAVFGNARTGIANNGALVKGMSSGNLIQHIPNGLEDYSAFLLDGRNSKWLKWQASGREYMELGDKCPFCAGDLAPQRDKIERINTQYDSKTIEHLSKILALFDRLGSYFSEETNACVREITTSVQGLSAEQKNYLVGIKGQVETLYGKLQQLKRIGFDSLKDIDRVADVLPTYKIEVQYLTHLNSTLTCEKVRIINESVDQLITEVGRLQGAVNQQKREIENTVRQYNSEINAFLRNAGYAYTVSIDETEDHSYKLKLRFGEREGAVSGVKSHLSYGERNAFALVLFMYNALYNKADFIVLDDPISSFDKNKKFAILDMLFIRGNSLRGKTALLLTHDFEPVIDTVYNHPSFFNGTPSAYFLENNNGILGETEIRKEHIASSVQIAKENIDAAPNIISKIIFLRRLVEIVDGKSNAWHLLSNLLHKRDVPTIGNDTMSAAAIADGTAKIQQHIPDFSYGTVYAEINIDGALIQLYNDARSNYEKLQIYRMIFPAAEEDHVMRKFLNSAYHVENDYLFQLNPFTFNTIPNYIISECDREVATLRENA